ncbi:TonB-dependent receptor plug domain-containing protein [Sandarakinorhabdus oryzae]|uniref:TonB-dependent receptor plug domain-containing protein n=1 Tax=Sandarakinorhabdus oryzae TaxID=2675220 RepID=UPI0012E275B9|nr:TonB-dependent receptor [Sandarakinorhabdus oryzae]
MTRFHARAHRGEMTLATSLLALALAGLSAPAIAADAADDQAATAAADGKDDTTIVVTGTRRTDRTVAESAVPIDVFTAQDLKVQASSSLQTVLKNLVPSFNQQRNAGADGSAFVRPPTLRGLPPDQILVLINGKRMHRSALVQVAGDSLSVGSQGPDLSQIPSIALGRIEVLRDGAAAQYGSDAIAGVINLGLRTNDSGIELNARYGQTYRGDGKDWQLNGNAGFKLGDGYLNISGEFTDQGLFNRALDRPDSAILRAAGVKVPSPPTRYGQPESQAFRFVVNSAIPVGDKQEVYFFGNYGQAKQEVDFNYRRPFGIAAQSFIPRPGLPASTSSFGKSIPTVYLDAIPGALTPQGKPIYDANGRTFEASQFYPDGFTPLFKSTNEDFSAAVGYRGDTAFGMHFDLSASGGMNKISYRMDNTLNPSIGPASPRNFYLGFLQQRELNLNLDVTYPIEVGFATPLNIAAGAEFRRETYVVGLGQVESYQIGPYAQQTVRRSDGTTFSNTAPIGANGFPGYSPDAATNTSRNSYSAYLDLETSIVESFDFGIAGRYDHFSDFGDTWNGKISARWAITPAIALRGAASTGFRAPTPGQSSTANVQTAFPNGSTVPVAVATVTPGSTTGIFFGSQPLKPEKSTSFSGGAVLTPGGGFNVTLDYYNIKVRDRIAITSSFNVTPAQQAALAALGVANAFDLGQVNYFTNGFKTRTQGVDFVASHRANTSAGNFNTSLAINYNKTKVIERTIPAAIDVRRAANIEGLTPRWRAVLAESWTSGMFDATARLNYFGKITSYNNQSALLTDPGTQEFRADVSFDLEVGVTFAEKYRVAVGGENIFNRYPEREERNIFPTTGAQANGRIYNDASPLSYMGGFWYLRASAKF